MIQCSTRESLKPLSNPPRSQLEEWRKKKESHEQVAVGEKVKRPSKELREVLGKDGGKGEGRKS